MQYKIGMGGNADGDAIPTVIATVAIRTRRNPRTNVDNYVPPRGQDA